MTRDPVAIFVSELCEYVPDADIRFRQGSCFGLYRLIRAFRPDARPWYDPIAGHVYTEVDGRFYDIGGRAHRLDGLIPLAQHKPRMARAWRWKFATAGARLIRERQIREAIAERRSA
jgi:hypothetical protein